VKTNNPVNASVGKGSLNQSHAMNPGPAGKSKTGLAGKLQPKAGRIKPINAKLGPAPGGIAKGNSLARGTPANSGNLAAKMVAPRNPK